MVIIIGSLFDLTHTIYTKVSVILSFLFFPKNLTLSKLQYSQTCHLQKRLIGLIVILATFEEQYIPPSLKVSNSKNHIQVLLSFSNSKIFIDQKWFLLIIFHKKNIES